MKKEGQSIDLSCLNIRKGSVNKYIEVLELREELLPILESLKGKEVLVNGEEHSFYYIGEDDPEDQSHIKARFVGRIVEVNTTGIRLNVESGERIYSQSSYLL